MVSWPDYKDKLARYFRFSRTELNGLIVLIIVFAFIYSFTRWGEQAFSLQAGLKNLLFALIIVGLSVMIHHSAQRMVGLWYGYRIEHRVWWMGLIIGLLAVVLSNGKVLIFVGSTLFAHFMPAHRIGKFRFGPSTRQIGASAFAGPLACVVISFFLALAFPSPFFNDFLNFNLLFAIYNMLPIPPLDGFLVYAGSKSPQGGGFWYKYSVSGIIAFFFIYFLTGLGFWWSLLLAALIGFAGWLILDTLIG